MIARRSGGGRNACAKAIVVWFVVCFAAFAFTAQGPPILEYIQQTWKFLTRSNATLAAAAVDPKSHPGRDGRWPVYVAAGEDIPAIENYLRTQMSPLDFQKIQLRPLPQAGEAIHEPGLLYLPKPYVVPGGRFNEMYGWDSYFIEVGLLRDGDVQLAKDMVDNALYEVRHFGKILNANRTYYLTRSQPPLLAEMILAVYRRTGDRKWLEDAVPAVEQYYSYWITAPHVTPETGLSRYFDSGEGPAPEVVTGESDKRGHTTYDLARAYFRTQTVRDYDATQYYNRQEDRLTNLFYTGDRSMRESGFDPSNRFGPFNVDVIHYNPVCLNSLLYLMETQMAEILEIVHRKPDAEIWQKRARDRAALINRLLWDSQDGLYYDYQFVTHQVRRYPFVTTFYPLWAGIASPEQAARIVKNLPLFERPGGLQTSTKASGDQWDAPFGWAPLQMIAIQGLRRYGYQKDADRISRAFLSLVMQEFRKHGTVLEKYDVVRRSSDLRGEIVFGYRSNEAGFGWTNAVFTALLDELPPAEQHAVLNP
jgi:alpha,alpha-trehalase